MVRNKRWDKTYQDCPATDMEQWKPGSTGTLVNYDISDSCDVHN